MYSSKWSQSQKKSYNLACLLSVLLFLAKVKKLLSDCQRVFGMLFRLSFYYIASDLAFFTLLI